MRIHPLKMGKSVDRHLVKGVCRHREAFFLFFFFFFLFFFLDIIHVKIKIKIFSAHCGIGDLGDGKFNLLVPAIVVRATEAETVLYSSGNVPV